MVADPGLVNVVGMRIVITGASGNLGTAVLRRLSASPADGGTGHELIGVVRRPPPVVAPYAGIRWHRIDLSAADATEQLVPVLAGADAVVHLAWGFQPSRDVDYLARLGVGGSAAVLSAATTAGVAHLVHMSSVGAYRAAPGQPRVTESWPHDGMPTSPYSTHKAAAEAHLDQFEAGPSAGTLTITRLRPGIVVQRAAGSALLRYGVPGYLPARAVGWLPVLPMDRRLRMPLIHADDVADAVARVLDRRAGGAFNLAGEPAINRGDIAAALGARAVQVPAGLLRSAVDLSWRAHLQQLDPGWVDLAFGVPLLDTTRARRELGWSPAVDTRAALAEVVAGMRETASTPSPVLRRRTVLDDVRTRLRDGSVGRRQRP